MRNGKGDKLIFSQEVAVHPNANQNNDTDDDSQANNSIDYIGVGRGVERHRCWSWFDG